MSEKENISNIPNTTKMATEYDINSYHYDPIYDSNIFTSEKFDKNTWTIIEKLPEPDEIKRLEILKKIRYNYKY